MHATEPVDVSLSSTPSNSEQKRKCLLTEQPGNSTYTSPTAWGDAHGPSARRQAAYKLSGSIMQAYFCVAMAGCASVQGPPTALSPNVVDWETELPVAGASAVLLDDELLVFSGYRVNSASVEASEPDLNIGRINTQDGGLAWESELVARGGSPSFEQVGSVLVVAQGSAIEALDASTGRYLWGAAFDQTPDLIGGSENLVILVLPDGIVNARDSRSGRSVWTVDTEEWNWVRMHSHDGSLYAVASSDSEIGVFLATYPSASPLWSARLSGEIGLTWEAGAELFARMDGTELRRADIRTGRVIGEPLEQVSGWTGRLRIESENVEGLVLRMQRVTAYTAGAPDEPAWSTTLPSTTVFSSPQSVLSGRGLFLNSSASSVLLDADTGEVVWRVPSGQQDGQCTMLGTTGHALLKSCRQFSSSRVIAEEIAD